MFTVKWVIHRLENEPIEVETGTYPDLDEAVSVCKERLPAMRLSHDRRPPDGFLICDSAGNEMRRWFGSARISA